MGAILAAIATVTAQWLPNWNRGFERVQRSRDARPSASSASSPISRRPNSSPPRAGIRQPVFDGTELSVTFLRTALGPNTRPGLELVRIRRSAARRA